MTKVATLEDRAMAVARAGFGPLPLPARMKWQPPAGSIGAADPHPAFADWLNWTDGPYPGYTNLGMRFPEGVFAIDVDSQKESGLAKWHELGGPDWDPTFRISARGFEDGRGHWLYRVPALHDAHELPGAWGGIETLRSWHRYSMAPGSWNPDAEAEYVLMDMRDGSIHPMMVPTDQIPVMSIEMWDSLVTRPAHVRADTSDEPLTSTGEGICGAVAAIRIPDWDEGSRYDTVNSLIWRLVRLEREGHRGVPDALIGLKTAYVTEMDVNPRPGGAPPETEFDRSVAQAEAKQTGYTDECRCDIPAWEMEAPLWDSSPQMRHVHDVAIGLRASPLGTLLAVLARLAGTTAPNIVLPPLVGGKASTNLFVMLVGDSGGGKGACESAAEQVFSYTNWPTLETPGSGEGLAHTFAHREKGAVVRHETNVLLTVAEVDTWQALSSRNGSTLDSEIRKAAMGEKLGFGYADPNKRIPVEAHSYRLSMIVGIQPGRAEWMMNSAAGGTPQRFVWAPTWNESAPKITPPAPAPLPWRPPLDYPASDAWGFVVLPVCDRAVAAVNDNRYQTLIRQSADPLDGHRLLVRLRVANALGLLHSRAGVNDQDWDLAGDLMRISNSVRRSIESALAQEVKDKNVGYALREVDKAEVIESKQEAQCLHGILHTLEIHRDRHPGKGCIKKCLKLGVRSTVRRHLNPTLERAIAAGQVVVDEHDRYQRGATP